MDRYCVVGGGSFRIGYPTARLARTVDHSLRRKIKGRVVLILTSSRRFSVNEIKRGQRVRRVRRRLPAEQRLKTRKNTWYVAPGHRSRLIVKTKRGRVREIGIADRRLTRDMDEIERFLGSWR
jgi:hypothetical protein